MITFPLTLRFCPDAPAPQRGEKRGRSSFSSADAWLIPSADVRVWLEEIGGWGVPMAGLRLFVLPKSIADPTPLAVLVTGAERLDRNRVCRALPYRVLAGRLYLPADARLDPDLSEQELRSKLIWEVQVLHPSAGLMGCNHEDALRVRDLIAPPRHIATDWDRAAPGGKSRVKLLSVEPEALPTIQILLEQARDDIGSEADEELPAAPDESTFREMLDRVRRMPLSMLNWVLSHMPAGGAGSGGLANWVRQHLQRIDLALEEARFRELERLRKLFESDPDEALRHAIPFRDTGPRGKAPPGAKLGSRDTDFNLRRLSGGRPGDPWNVPDRMRNDLITKYRAAANRELTLGRYRRAAYIFAELLGDKTAAASALRQGRFYREAAALYIDCKNPLQAAECLEQGGLLLEAVAIYEELNRHEKAGDLYQTIGRTENALRCYRIEANRAIARHDPLEAARLLERKLNSPDEALELLTKQWPDSSAAVASLRESFELLARLGRHDETARRVAALRDETLREGHVRPVAHLLSKLATDYPSPPVQEQAADVTRIVAGRRLALPAGAETRALVEAVTRLNPEDRLLTRDGSRFLERRPSRPPPPVRSIRDPQIVRQFQLPTNVEWARATAAADFIYATGATGREFVIARARWDGIVQTVPWLGSDPRQCALEPLQGGRVLLVLEPGVVRRVSSGFARLAKTDAFGHECLATRPEWQPQGLLLGVCQDERGTIWWHTYHEHQAVFTSSNGDSGQLLFSCAAPVPSARPSYLAARKEHLFAASGKALLILGIERNSLAAPRKIELPGEARGIAASPPFTRVRVAVALEEGGRVIWDDGTEHPFAEGLIDPMVAFTRSGMLVAIANEEGRVYFTDGTKVTRHASFALPAPGPVSVMPGSRLNEFALLWANGTVRLFQVPL